MAEQPETRRAFLSSLDAQALSLETITRDFHDMIDTIAADLRSHKRLMESYIKMRNEKIEMIKRVQSNNSLGSQLIEQIPDPAFYLQAIKQLLPTEHEQPVPDQHCRVPPSLAGGQKIAEDSEPEESSAWGVRDIYTRDDNKLFESKGHTGM